MGYSGQYMPQVEAQNMQTRDSDGRGRIYLGSEYANKRVTVAVVDVENDGPSDEELAAAYRDTAEEAARIEEEWGATSDEAWSSLE